MNWGNVFLAPPLILLKIPTRTTGHKRPRWSRIIRDIIMPLFDPHWQIVERQERNPSTSMQWTTASLFFLTLVSFQFFTRLHLCSIVYMQLRFKWFRDMSCCGLKQSHTKKCQFVQQCKLHMTRPNIRDDTERVTTVKVVTVVIIWTKQTFQAGLFPFCPFWWFCPFCWPHLGQFPAKVKQAVDRICE